MICICDAEWELVFNQYLNICVFCYESDDENTTVIWHYEGIHAKDRKCQQDQGNLARQYPKCFNHVISWPKCKLLNVICPIPVCWMDFICVHVCFVAEAKSMWLFEWNLLMKCLNFCGSASSLKVLMKFTCPHPLFKYWWSLFTCLLPICSRGSQSKVWSW